MSSVAELAQRAKAAAPSIAQLSTIEKNRALMAAAQALVSRAPMLLEANAKDLTSGSETGASPAVLDRLRLDEKRIQAMANGLQLVTDLKDPNGEITDGWVLPNGVSIRRVRVPLGVVAVIYENRPNVTSDAAGLCLKSGNVAFLRGSSGAINSNIAIANVVRAAFEGAGVSADALLLVQDVSRESAVAFMQQTEIDCLIPRGGPGLIASIRENATVPFILDGDGNCHIYVDRSADLDMALDIIENAKVQRPSVCNAAESLVVHSDVAAELLPLLHKRLASVTFAGDETACRIMPGIDRATEDDFASEFLDLRMSVAVVDCIDDAIEWITRYSTGHSEAIIARDVDAISAFTKRVDAAAVVVNTSTRFVDGEQFGFGAEIGISTQKLHARGPLGLAQLTTCKYIVEGNGQVRT